MRYLISLGLIFAIVTNFCVANGTVRAQTSECKQIFSVFVRGSGTGLNDKNYGEWVLRTENIANKSNISITSFELGSNPNSTYSYPAAAVVGWPLGYATGLDAKVSGTNAGIYNRSVAIGVEELVQYVEDIHQQCPDSHIIMAGHSQGAQVIGEAIAKIPPENRAQIDFVAFYGDPKLTLPEGKWKSVWEYPDACYNRNLSPWRRTIANCTTSYGTLGARTVYIPEDMQNKVGLWCNDRDLICNGNPLEIPKGNGGHESYRNTGDAIEKSALEALSKVKESIRRQADAKTDAERQADLARAAMLEKQIDAEKYKQRPHDIAILVDATAPARTFYTGSATGTEATAFNPLYNTLRAMQAANPDTRISLVTFAHRTAPYLTRIGMDFSDSIDTLRDKINSIEYTSRSTEGWYYYKTASYDAMNVALDSLSWRDDSYKSMYVFASAGLSSGSSLNTSTVRDKLLRKEVHATAMFLKRDPYGDVYQGSQPDCGLNMIGGKCYVWPYFVWRYYDNLFRTEPYLNILGELNASKITGFVGEAVTLDASQLYSPPACKSISSYSWDMKNDYYRRVGSNVPTHTYTYTAPYTGWAIARVSAPKHGDPHTLCTTAKAVWVDIKARPSTLPATPEPAKDITVPTKITSGQVELTWQAGTTKPDSWIVSLNDMPIAKTASDTTHITVTDLDKYQDNTFAVAGMMEHGFATETSMVSIAAEERPAPEVPPTQEPDSETAEQDLPTPVASGQPVVVQPITTIIPAEPGASVALSPPLHNASSRDSSGEVGVESAASITFTPAASSTQEPAIKLFSAQPNQTQSFAGAPSNHIDNNTGNIPTDKPATQQEHNAWTQLKYLLGVAVGGPTAHVFGKFLYRRFII